MIELDASAIALFVFVRTFVQVRVEFDIRITSGYSLMQHVVDMKYQFRRHGPAETALRMDLIFLGAFLMSVKNYAPIV